MLYVLTPQQKQEASPERPGCLPVHRYNEPRLVFQRLLVTPAQGRNGRSVRCGYLGEEVLGQPIAATVEAMCPLT